MSASETMHAAVSWVRATVVVLLLGYLTANAFAYNVANVVLTRAMLGHSTLSLSDNVRLNTWFVAAEPRHSGALIGEARLALLRGQREYGTERLREAARRAGRNPLPTFLLGEELRQLGDLDAAVRAYSAAELSENRFLFEGRIAAADNRWRAADQSYGIAAAIRPESAAAQRAWGEAQVNLSRFDAGIASYRRALALGVADGYLRIQIAHAQQMARYDDAALETLDQAASDHPMAHAIRGAIYLKRNRVPEAVNELHRAVEQDPRNVWALFDYGNALCAAGRAAEARTWWLQARRLDPNFVPAAAARCDK